MIVKMIDVFGHGRAVPMLCDDEGKPLPGQVNTVFDSGPIKGRPSLTVTFMIDGDRIRSD